MKAPIAGILVFVSNYSQGWMNAKPFKVGDNVWPGMELAEIPDLTRSRWTARSRRSTAAASSAGQDVRVRVDSLPEADHGCASSIASRLLTEHDVSNGRPPAASALRAHRQAGPAAAPRDERRHGHRGQPHPERHQHPGQSAVHARRQADRVRGGQQGSTAPVEVEVLARNPDEVAIKRHRRRQRW